MFFISDASKLMKGINTLLNPQSNEKKENYVETKPAVFNYKQIIDLINEKDYKSFDKIYLNCNDLKYKFIQLSEVYLDLTYYNVYDNYEIEYFIFKVFAKIFKSLVKR